MTYILPSEKFRWQIPFVIKAHKMAASGEETALFSNFEAGLLHVKCKTN